MMPSFSIDGTDCRIQLPTARLEVRPVGLGGDHGGGAFISHKFNMAALRYYICMHICKPIIVLAGGGYPAGSRHDLNVARCEVAPRMRADERGIADHGYHLDSCFLTPLKSNSRLRRVLPPDFVDAFHESMSHVRGRHEHVNAELKEWAVLADVFRHHPEFHPECFRAVAELTQLRFHVHPSIIPPPQYSPLFIEDDNRLRILRFNEDGSVADMVTL